MSRVPKYCRQIRVGKPATAYVKIDGERIYLGLYNSPESRAEYARLIGRTTSPAPLHRGLTVDELIVAFLNYASSYYPNRRSDAMGEYGDCRRALTPLHRMFGDTAATDFGPKRLKEVRQAMIEGGLARRTVNQQVRRIVNVFRWAVEEELLPPATHQALAAVRPLQRGRTAAKETTPVSPVGTRVVESTLAELSDVVGDMVRIQLLTGMRPGELVQMRPCDMDRSGEVWTYTPPTHKTQHRGKVRTIAIGPKAQALLLRYLARASVARCFLYSVDSYRRAVERAANRAGVEHWTPHRLRHSAATLVRSEFGLDGAQAMLGHSDAKVTQIYAELNLEKAAEIARRIG